jgi:hypothetical protein
MNPFLRNGLAIIAGIFIGALVNFGIILIIGTIIPLPEGVDTSDIESMKTSMNLYEPKHYLFPFLAHALGTLFGGIVAAKIAVSAQTKVALVVGIIFLYGGFSMVIQLPSALWFNLLDLTVAYIPMAWLGAKLVQKLNAYKK